MLYLERVRENIFCPVWRVQHRILSFSSFRGITFTFTWTIQWMAIILSSLTFHRFLHCVLTHTSHNLCSDRQFCVVKWYEAHTGSQEDSWSKSYVTHETSSHIKLVIVTALLWHSVRGAYQCFKQTTLDGRKLDTKVSRSFDFGISQVLDSKAKVGTPSCPPPGISPVLDSGTTVGTPPPPPLGFHQFWSQELK